jgi:hypothetical protein
MYIYCFISDKVKNNQFDSETVSDRDLNKMNCIGFGKRSFDFWQQHCLKLKRPV